VAVFTTAMWLRSTLTPVPPAPLANVGDTVPRTAHPGAAHGKPNIVIILADNLGYGEVACYGGARMVPTPRIDHLAAEGLRLTNFNVEIWCSPSRSALLTGRYGVRSGTDQVATSGPKGLVEWEVTLAELLSARGYATAAFGKWHLGDREGRLPTDQGFDEWYGVPNTWDEGTLTTKGYIPAATPSPVLECVKGRTARQVKILDSEAGRMIDRDLTGKSVAYIERNARAGRSFFLYVPMTAVHRPVYSHPDFTDKSGAGPIGDAVMGMDFNVGLILDAVMQAGIEDNTIFIFASDDGPDLKPWKGNAGPWSGYLDTAREGSLRTPCIIRWPGHVPAGRVSNEIVHITDLFTTLARAAGAGVPTDRAIDGVDQMSFFTGKQETSNREGFPVYAYGHLYAVKWHDWKMHYVRKAKNLYNVRTDPREEQSVYWSHTEVDAPMQQIVTDFEASLVKYPLIVPGAPDPYRPPRR
jgi:arylsulfatase